MEEDGGAGEAKASGTLQPDSSPKNAKKVLLRGAAATNKLAGTNSSVIRTPQVEEGGLRVGPVIGWLLRNSYTKLITRTLLLQRAMGEYKRAAFEDDYQLWQAGKGVDGIHTVETCADVLEQFGAVAKAE